MNLEKIERSEITLLAHHTHIIGTFNVKKEAHIYGKITGEIKGEAGSEIILKEGSLVEGKIFADRVIIEGFMKGEITAHHSVWITPHGKIVGTVKCSSLKVDPGAVFEAKVELLK